MSVGVPRPVFEQALKAALVSLAVAEGILPTAHDAKANHELYQRLCVFIDLGLEQAGMATKPRPPDATAEQGTSNVVRLH